MLLLALTIEYLLHWDFEAVSDISFQVKCDQYWPDSGQQEYGAFTVKLLKEDIWTDNAFRKFSIAEVRFYICVDVLEDTIAFMYMDSFICVFS